VTYWLPAKFYFYSYFVRKEIEGRDWKDSVLLKVDLNLSLSFFPWFSSLQYHAAFLRINTKFGIFSA
jgi:hypothetical protein